MVPFVVVVVCDVFAAGAPLKKEKKKRKILVVTVVFRGTHAVLDRDTDKQDAKLLSHTHLPSLSFVCVNDDAVNCASPVTSNNLATD